MRHGLKVVQFAPYQNLQAFNIKINTVYTAACIIVIVKHFDEPFCLTFTHSHTCTFIHTDGGFNHARKQPARVKCLAQGHLRNFEPATFQLPDNCSAP